MKSVKKYGDLVAELVAKGVNFEADVFCRTREIDWDGLAERYGYIRPKTAYFSRGGCFYLLLQKVYKKMNTNK